MTKTESETERLERLMRDKFERPLPKRFYTSVQVSEDNRILLDGRAIKTPLKAALQLPNTRLAGAVAAEWAAQEAVVNPALMPVTKLANTAIDRATSERAGVLAEISRYAGNDLVCYWADRPPDLVKRQQALWQPVMAWVETTFDVAPVQVSGLMHASQPQALLDAVARKLANYDNWQLTAAYLLTTLAGSAFIAMQLIEGTLGSQAAWDAMNLEEDYQISQWGEDWEAKIRREARKREFEGLVQFLELLR